MTPKTNGPAVARHLRAHALLVCLVLGSLLAACDGSSDEPPPKGLSSTLVDGKVCGLFSKDLVASVVGHRDVSVHGTGIGDAEKRESNTIDCKVVDERSITTRIIAIVAEAPGKSDYTATAKKLNREYADGGAGTCSQPAAVSGMGPGYTCTLPSGELYVNVLLPKRMVRLVYDPRSDAPPDHLATAVKLVKDVDANIDAYDKKHAG